MLRCRAQFPGKEHSSPLSLLWCTGSFRPGMLSGFSEVSEPHYPAGDPHPLSPGCSLPWKRHFPEALCRGQHGLASRQASGALSPQGSPILATFWATTLSGAETWLSLLPASLVQAALCQPLLALLSQVCPTDLSHL